MTGASDADNDDCPAMSAGDGIAKVQAQAPRALPRRFYKTVSVAPAFPPPPLRVRNEEEGNPGAMPGETDSTRQVRPLGVPPPHPLPTKGSGEERARLTQGFHVLLDGRITKTPATKRPLVLPSKTLAEAIAAEWNAQHDVIDPETMGLTRLANTAVDGVAGAKSEVVADLVAYAASDALCYRAETPEALAARQSATWDPLLRLVEHETGASFVTVSGIMPVEQPRTSLDRLKQALSAENEFRLTALHVMTTLTGSALLALLVCRGVIKPGDAWAAANVEEDWQIAQWGEDLEAGERRARRWRDMQSAAHFLALLADDP